MKDDYEKCFHTFMEFSMRVKFLKRSHLPHKKLTALQTDKGQRTVVK